MTLQFVKATKAKAFLRLAIIGPSGSGKTYTSLRLASSFGRVAVIDTERGSASKYSGVFQFDVLELPSFEPETYIQALKVAESSGYDVVVIDSLSHAWMGKGGALEQVDKAAKRSQSGNSFTAWRDVTPRHNALVDAILQYPGHEIITMRAKTEWVLEEDHRGKKVPRKIGMAPIQRDGLEYEFDVVADMNLANEFIVSKSRCPELHGAVVDKPGDDLAKRLLSWLSDGATAPKLKPPAPTVSEVGALREVAFPMAPPVGDLHPSLQALVEPKSDDDLPPSMGGSPLTEEEQLEALIKEVSTRAELNALRPRIEAVAGADRDHRLRQLANMRQNHLKSQGA